MQEATKGNTELAVVRDSSLNESQMGGGGPNSARSSQSPSMYSKQGGGMSQSMTGYGSQYRQSNKLSQEIRVKKMIQNWLDSKFVTVVMSLVTVFALVGVSLFQSVKLLCVCLLRTT